MYFESCKNYIILNNLIVDIGNTRAKVAIMDGEVVLWRGSFEDIDETTIAEISQVASQYALCGSIVSSTRGDAERVSRLLRRVTPEVLIFDATTPIPIRNSYATPSTLGRDRLAAAVGAWERYGEEYENLLIIDMGSAITIDLVTREGGFEGGTISPGVDMRLRALHEFTAKLPLCTQTEEIIEIARTTQEAIQQGVMRGVIYEIEGHISYFNNKYDKIAVIFTGGDAKKLVKRIKNTIFAEFELVEVGLNRILEYNAK